MTILVSDYSFILPSGKIRQASATHDETLEQAKERAEYAMAGNRCHTYVRITNGLTGEVFTNDSIHWQWLAPRNIRRMIDEIVRE